MPFTKRAVVYGTLLTAAMTALAVKATLSTPVALAAQQPLSVVKKGLSDARDAALADSQPLLDQAQARFLDMTPDIGTTTYSVALPAGRGATDLQDAPIPAVALDAGASKHASGPARMRNILVAAAKHHGVDPRLVLALAYWESGWDQSRVSVAGAVGLMQVEPATAATAGPALLGRTVNINDPYDNADVGVAVLREDLDNFGSSAMALAAYYQGPTSLKQYGLLPDTQQYVAGILSLAAQMSP